MYTLTSLIIAHLIPKITFQSYSDAAQTLLNDSTVNSDISFKLVVDITCVTQSVLFSEKASIATTTSATNVLCIPSLANSTLNITSSPSTASVDTGIHILHI